MTPRTAIALALVVPLVAAAPVAGAVPSKGPIGLGANPTSGIVSPDGEYRYLTTQTADGTLIQRLETDGGTVDRLTHDSRILTVPAVAYDGSPAGLSADGETLVLIEPDWRFPRRSSRFVVFDADRLQPRPTIELPGTWSFDALSPDGRKMYLIEYTSAGDITEYLVRSYDLVEGRLDPKPIIDPDEPGDAMFGTAVTRASDAEGRWAYTLYERAENRHPPFIHALDTKRGIAACIDLDVLAGDRGDGISRMTLQPSPDGGSLTVAGNRRPLATVDLASFEVSPAASEPPAQSEARADPLGWAVFALGLGLLGAGSLAALVARRRRARRIFHEELERV